MSVEPILSIVVPAYNRASNLLLMIESAGHRNDPEVEIVISDDCSDSTNFAVIQNASIRYSNLKIYTNTVNLGMVRNWNRSLQLASGKWICFMCDDDVFVPGGVDRILELIKNCDKKCLFIQSPGITEEVEECVPGRETVRGMNLPIVSGNFWHRDIYEKLGGFDERLKYSPDGEFWYRIAGEYPVVKLKSSTARFIYHENNFEYSTWAKDDFLDQVGLLSSILFPYYYAETDNAPEKRQQSIDDGKDKTIWTILFVLCWNFRRRALFKKYYSIALARRRNRIAKINFRFSVLRLLLCRGIIKIAKAVLNFLGLRKVSA